MRLRVGINTQTPPLRFLKSPRTDGGPRIIPLRGLREGEDYVPTPGGVTSMIHDLLREMFRRRYLRGAHWVSLNPSAPRVISDGAVLLHSVHMKSEDLVRYARLKESIWEETHGLRSHAAMSPDFVAYARYNWFCAERMLELPVDVLYIHDFHQLQVGTMVGLAAPAVFRWHVPLRLEQINRYTQNFMVRCMEGFDGVVVSCKRDLEGLLRAGYHGPARQIYPYTDPRRWRAPGRSDREALARLLDIGEDDPVLLVVARMDPIKDQETAIRALKALRDPRVRLVLVGDGSFTSSAGGLSSGKGAAWRGRLEALALELSLASQVRFTGYLPPPLLAAAYHRADAVLLPSRTEGFGLAVVEGWLYKKPAVVSRGAGMSELILDGVNGLLHRPGDAGGLADALRSLLRKPGWALRLGEAGRETARQCDVRHAAPQVHQFLQEAVEGFPRR